MKRPSSAILIKYLFLLVATGWSVSVFAAGLCASPGKAGSPELSGVINTYWAAPAGASLRSGQRKLPLGQRRGEGSLQPGDLLLLIQMQGAYINAHNDRRYGAGGSSGRGWEKLSAGRYEWVVVASMDANTVTVNGAGPDHGILHPYHFRQPKEQHDQGRAVWQLVKVPQYKSLSLTGDLQALPWNGSTGGVLALDVRQTLNIRGHTLSAAGDGFRGGAALPLKGALGTTADYRYPAPSKQNIANGYGQHGSKGEGLAGTPRWVFFQHKRLDTLAARGRNSSDGYPGGSMAKGAPANAGGGGESLSLDNRRISAGGGGGGGLAGHTGHDAKGRAKGGIGGAGVGDGNRRLVMGGGGGAAAGGGESAVFGSGGSGGGIVIIRAGRINGPGRFDVSGSDGHAGVAGGGGGGAGSLLLWAPLTGQQGNFQVRLSGGKGGNGRQGKGGKGGAGRLITAGAMVVLNKKAVVSGHLNTHASVGVMPAFRCQPSGVIISGSVFDDNGAGHATPFDGLQTGHEKGLSGWSYELRAGSKQLASGKTNAEGRFSLTLPERLKAGKPGSGHPPLTLSIKSQTGWVIVAANHSEAGGLTYQGKGGWQLDPGSGGYFQQIRLGVVKSPQFSGPGRRTIAPDSTNILPFRYMAHAPSRVRFSANVKLGGRLLPHVALFIDPHCNGQSHFTSNGSSDWFDVKAGQSLCVRLKVVVGKQTKGKRLSVGLQAETQFQQISLQHKPLVKKQVSQYRVK